MREHPDAVATQAMLELAASERPDDLLWLLDTLSNSPAGFAIAALRRDWQTPRLQDLAAVTVKAARDLDRLERRLHWKHPRQVVVDPHVPALRLLAAARRARAVKPRRLDVIGRKLRVIDEAERQRRRLEKFIREPGDPVDPAWLRRFLRQDSRPDEDGSQLGGAGERVTASRARGAGAT